jgi:N-acetylmuramoyl-L-alanine amidase
MHPGRCLSIVAACALMAVGSGAAASASGHSAPLKRQQVRRAGRHAGRHAGALAGVTVGINAGHNGDNYRYPGRIDRKIWNGREWESCDTTGTATDSGYTESLFNFRVGNDLRRDLHREGARVVRTRRTNHGVGPCVDKRAEIINRSHAAVGINIHADGGPPGGRGFAILEPVRDKENRHVVKLSARFGRLLRQRMLAMTPMPTSTYDGRAGINHRDDLAGLNLTTVPLVLIECGNMRNSRDARLLTSRRFQHQLARAFASAITRFVRYRRDHGGLGDRTAA